MQNQILFDTHMKPALQLYTITRDPKYKELCKLKSSDREKSKCCLSTGHRKGATKQSNEVTENRVTGKTFEGSKSLKSFLKYVESIVIDF